VTGSTSARGWESTPSQVDDCGAKGGKTWVSTANHSTRSRPTKNVGVAYPRKDTPVST
jgi:hypothetical protein